ncbi:MAG: ABC transporter permease subunit [Candidatus Shapirobacteria bacterium]|jgi:ABC-2 type transport system permease protein
MRIIKAIAIKEWRGWWGSPTGYIFAGLLLIIANWLFFNDLFILGQADAGPLFTTMAFLLSIFVPAVAMGLLSEEKRSGTWEVLLTSPINEWQMVVGKFVGVAVYLASVMTMLIPAVLTVYFLGRPDYGPMISQWLTTILLAWGYLALGLFMSSLTSQPVVAFILTTLTLLINNLFSQEMLLSRIDGQWREMVAGLSLGFRAGKMGGGLIELNNLLFFLSFMAVFLILTVIVVKNRDK